MSRKPTAEELRLWRESNRFTTRKAVLEAGDWGLEETEETLPPTLPKPLNAVPPIACQSPASSPKPLAPLTGREARRLLSAAGAIEATLDLHGLIKIEAYPHIRRFITEASRRGLHHVAIITGKGRGEGGVLRRELPHWLNEPDLRPLISAMAHAKPEKGGDGVLHVLVKRKRMPAP